VHIDVTGAKSQAQVIIEANTSQHWIENAQLIRDMLDASTSSNWSISGDHVHSQLVAQFGR
jgi:hypothetical protein